MGSRGRLCVDGVGSLAVQQTLAGRSDRRYLRRPGGDVSFDALTSRVVVVKRDQPLQRIGCVRNVDNLPLRDTVGVFQVAIARQET